VNLAGLWKKNDFFITTLFVLHISRIPAVIKLQNFTAVTSGDLSFRQAYSIFSNAQCI